MLRIASRQGWKTAKSIVGATALILVLNPILAGAYAKGPAEELTQGEYLRLLVKASASKTALPANASAVEFVKWAAARGVMPDGGWKLDAQLTREVYAQTLAQLYGVSAGNDPVRALKREGVIVPTTALIDRAKVLRELGDFGFHSATADNSRGPATPIRPEPGAVVCHNGSTVVISQSAGSEHRKHGDSDGVCPPKDVRGGDKNTKGDDDHGKKKP